MQKREVTVDSYSETISSDSSSDDRITIETENSTTSMEDNIEDNSCIKKRLPSLLLQWGTYLN